jgi:hypothetical protein
MTDIMALLFSLFLLLPHLEQQSARSGRDVRPGSIWTPDEQRQAREELDRLRRLTRLPANQRLFLVVLDIDGDTGDLFLQEGTAKKRLSRQSDMDEMVGRHLEAARAGQRELYYVLRPPPKPPSGFPSHPDYRDERLYEQWFGKWNVPYDIAGYRRTPGT